MNRLIVLALMLVGGCEDTLPRKQPIETHKVVLDNQGREQHIMVWHDDKRGVTCYIIYSSDSCVADSALKDGGYYLVVVVCTDAMVGKMDMPYKRATERCSWVRIPLRAY